MAHFEHVRTGGTQYDCGLILQVHLKLITGRFVQRVGRFETFRATGGPVEDKLGLLGTGTPVCAHV